MNRKGFTLVELIVVITILAVLWTISFVSLQWYASEGRDSKRISDVNSIRKVLEYDVLKKWYYILPENWVNVTYSTWWESKAVWQQWIFWESNRVELWAWNSLSKVPRDPLTNTYYTYSVLNTKKEIQIWAVLEWWVSYWPNLITDTYARWNEIWWSYIVWNYNGKVAKVTMWWNMYIFAVPSIISTDLWTPDILSLLDNKKFAINSTSKLPWSYDRTNYNLEAGNELILNTVNQPILTVWSSDDIDKTQLLINLQNAYTWTYVWSLSSSDLLSVDSSDIEEVEKYIEEWISDWLETSDLVITSNSWNNWTWNPEIAEPTYTIWSNWVTVKCWNLQVWSTFVHNWVNYLIVDNSTIHDSIWNIDANNNICTSHVTELFELWYDQDTWDLYSHTYTFNQDITSWDTSNVTSMKWAFFNFRDLNQNLNYWDFSKVLDMEEMLWRAYDFNNWWNSLTWNTSRVTNMAWLFYLAQNFNQELHLDYSSVESMYKMFYWAFGFNNWWVSLTINAPNLLYLTEMFYYSYTFNQELNITTDSVTSICKMFIFANSFNQDVSEKTLNWVTYWNTSNVTCWNNVFDQAVSFNNWNQPFNWRTDSLNYAWAMFANTNNFNQDISEKNINWVTYWNMSNVENTSYMFTNAISFNNWWQPLNWVMDNNESVRRMFFWATNFNQDVNTKVLNWVKYWDISTVNAQNDTTQFSRFIRDTSYNHDLNSWCVSNIASIPSSFADWSPLQWDTARLPQWWTCPVVN